MKALYWFRRDRRLADNEALVAASEYELAPVVAIDNFDSLLPNRAHSLLESIKSLDASLGNKLNVSQGPSSEVLLKLARAYEVQTVFAPRAYGTEGMLEQAAVAEGLQAD